MFLLEERKDLENGQQLITATGFHERQGLAFEIVLGKSWSGSGGDSVTPPMRVGIVSIRRHRELSDLLMQVMSQPYSTKAKPARMRDEVRFSGISLLGDPAHLEQGPANIKLFHESDKEDESDETPLPLDDNLMFAMMLEPQLRRLGHRVQTLCDGPNLAHRLVAAQPDLILVKPHHYPDQRSRDYPSLRSNTELKKTGIIGYAGHEENAYFHAALDAGADMVMPNSAIKSHLPKVLAKLAKLKSGEASVDGEFDPASQA